MKCRTELGKKPEVERNSSACLKLFLPLGLSLLYSFFNSILYLHFPWLVVYIWSQNSLNKYILVLILHVLYFISKQYIFPLVIL